MQYSIKPLKQRPYAAALLSAMGLVLVLMPGTQGLAAATLGPNHAPSFQAGPDITVCKNAGAQSIPNWATQITDGDNGRQTIEFITESDNTELFGTLLGAGGQPAISPDGSLYFRPALDAAGTAHVSVRLEDDGAQSSDGPITTEPQYFSITVDAQCDGGAGELFTADQFDYDFGLAAAGDVPLQGLQVLDNGLYAQPWHFTLINRGETVDQPLTLELQLAGHEQVVESDPRCEGDAVSGAYECQFDTLPSGETTLEFQVAGQEGVTATAGLTPSSEPGRTQQTTTRHRRHGGGSIGLSMLALLLLARRRDKPSLG